MNWKNKVNFKKEVMNKWEDQLDRSGRDDWENFYEENSKEIVADTIKFIKSYSFFDNFNADSFKNSNTLEEYNDILNNLYDFADDNKIWMGL